MVHSLHALRGLSGDFNGVDELELRLVDVDVAMKRRPLAPLRHDGQDLLRRDAAHEQENVDVSGS